MEKLLTIIIPSYNMEKYLSICLDSLLIPSIDKIEILIINDGSKDNTLEIANQYHTQYPNSIRVIDKENGNYGSCINRGLKEATGKYIKVLDADDSFDKSVFEDFVNFLGYHDCDLIISDYVMIDELGNILSEKLMTSGLEPNTVLPFNGLFEDKHQIIGMHGITYKTQNLRDMGYTQTEGISYTDQEWIFSPMIKVKTAAIFPKVLYKYLIGRIGQTVSADFAKRIVPFELITKKEISILRSNFETIDESHRNYLIQRIIFSLKSVYDLIILDSKFHEYNIFLSEFDEKYIKSFTPLFKITSELLYKSNIPFKYINIWRKSDYKFNNWKLRLFRQILNIYRTL